jgi:ribosomal RNA assembly protein
MIKLIIDKLPRIIKNKKKLEKELNVKITNRGKEVYVNGSGENEYIAEKVILALDFGFPFSDAMLITKDHEFEILNIKEYTHRRSLEKVRGRIIGTGGKALQTLCQLTGCCFEMKDNKVGIIGPPECMKNAQEAIVSLAHGAKHGNVYGGLKRNPPQIEDDLGLRGEK